MQNNKNFAIIITESERKIQKVEKITHLQILKNFDIIITETNKKQKKKEVAIMTKREYFEKIKTMVTENAELAAFVDKEIAKIDARNDKAKAKRVAKAGDAATAIATAAIEALETAGRAITLAELVAATEYPAGKVAYYIRPLVADGTIVKEKAKVGDRKIMTYKLA